MEGERIRLAVPSRWMKAPGLFSEARRGSRGWADTAAGEWLAIGSLPLDSSGPFLGASFYGSSSSGDAQGYELYVIASAVVGGASLIGGKGSALGAMLGALLIVLIRQSIRTLHFDQNYEWIVIGCAIIIAVVVDQWSTRAGARRLSLAREQVRTAA